MALPYTYIAGSLYTEYCHAVGGKAFNGDPLPTWEVFQKDPAKTKQRDAWIAVAVEAASHFPPFPTSPTGPTPSL